MSTRNLTHEGLNIHDESSSSDSIQNPFGNHNELDDDDEEHNYRLDDLEYSTDSSSPSNAKPSSSFGNNGSNSRLSPNGIGLNTPSEFDRYPSGSRVVSLNSSAVGSKASLLNGGDESYNNLTTTTSGNPFLVDADFSPFGGYPLTSFPLHIDEEEADDYLHNPDPVLDLLYDKNRFMDDLKNMDKRSAGGLLGLLLMLLGIVAVMIILPVLTYSGVTGTKVLLREAVYTVLSDYEYPQLSAIRTDLIDPDTPDDAMTRKARDGSLWQLTFSDEFNAEGRTFYEGDDQFFYAADFNYASTRDLEWYDPDAITTKNGTLQLRLDLIKQHDLFYRSGMLHSWNRMCFTQGIMEVSVKLPNYGNVSGLWPGMWSMGNLGRPGYMATTDGVWPYSYDSCDAGITPNQSSPDGISYLPGQKLNACTCKGETHPNRGVGRGAPEIDAFEGEVDTTLGVGVASQSLQLLPMDIWYYPDENWIEIHNHSVSSMNTYTGGPFQQAVSATTTLNTKWYQKGDFENGEYQKYAFEYLNDDDEGYIRWFVGDEPTMTMHAYLLAPNGNINWRRISKEPMSVVLNLGLSNNWAYIDWNSIEFPAIMQVDHIRIYQPNDSVLMTCDPDDYPTYDYINDHPKAYLNYNHTTWEMAGYSFPKNNLTGC